MPQIGWLEILIIVSIAIIVVGPKDFPVMIKKNWWLGWFYKKIYRKCSITSNRNYRYR